MQSKLKPKKPPSSLPKSNSTSEICLHQPSYINSAGIWSSHDDPRWWLNNSLPLLELQLVLIFSLITFIQFVLKRFGVSKLSCQIIAGLIFGCSWKQWDVKKFQLFTVDSETILGLLAYFGYSLYLFLAAVKTDVTMTIRTGKKALIIGIPALLMPLICGFMVQTYFQYSLTKTDKTMLPIMVSLHAMTSFPVIASLLSDLQIVSSELGRLGLSSALVSDLLSLFMMTVASQAKRYKDDPSLASVELATLLLLLFVVLFAFRPMMLWIIKQTPEGEPVRRSFIQSVIFMALISAVTSSFTGQSAIIGPYILGLAVPDGAPLGATLVDRIETFVSEGFLPILVTTCALRADLSEMSASLTAGFTQLNIIITFVTFLVKIITCFLTSQYCKLPFKDSLALSLIMSCKGVVELVLYTLARDVNGIGDGLYEYLILIILLAATFVPMAVRWLYDPSRKYAGYQNRNIMYLNPNSELRVLVCLHRNENIYGIVHLLNLSCPTVENPLAVYVFHLIELIGRTSPIFISHRLQKKTLNDQSYSENIILSFDHFERENDGTVYVECFTAISPNKYMHDDICTLALDKITSLIILPFHRTWTTDGLVDQDDNMIRTLNCSVLERAPCSVGIFADRGQLGRIAAMASAGMICSYSVCVIYLGGKDDREALSYAKRMAKDPRVELTVIRLMPLEDAAGSWEKMLDSEVLRDFKLNCLVDGNVTYMEEICKDGPQTALRLRKLVNGFDLMVVGRRHGLETPQTAGLSEWNEFPELGVLGDLIASTDINSRSSVLVIQQQMIKHF